MYHDRVQINSLPLNYQRRATASAAAGAVVAARRDYSDRKAAPVGIAPVGIAADKAAAAGIVVADIAAVVAAVDTAPAASAAGTVPVDSRLAAGCAQRHQTRDHNRYAAE